MKNFPKHAATLLRVSLLGIVIIPLPALGQEVACDALIAEARSRGESPTLALDASGGQVQLQTSFGTCRESAPAWSARKLSLVQDRKGEMKVRLPAPRPSLPVARPKAASSGHPGTRARFATNGGTKCDLHLGDLWKPVRVQLTGGTYWLDRVFTIDLDGNGQVDNMGFLFKHEKGGEDLSMQYFGVSGEVGVSELPGLGLTDDRMLERLCFGSLRLDHPSGHFQVPAEQPKAPEKKEKQDIGGVMDAEYGGSTLWVGLGIAAAVVLLVGLVLALLRWFRRKTRKGKDLLPSEFADEWEGDE